MKRRDYPINITINNRHINRVIIDNHYEENHADTINDELIINLVLLLNEGVFSPIAEKDGFQYFKTEPILLNDKKYRLIWLLEENEIYIGIINAFRR